MTHDRAWIAAHIPHQGSMCLLEAVVEWDEQTVLCRSRTHRDPANPLRAGGRLGSAMAIEYAAQAAAVHGALRALEGPIRASSGTRVSAAPSSPAPPGLLASARGVRLAIRRLDDLEEELLVRAQALQSGPNGASYTFTVGTAARPSLVQGRLSLWLPGGT